MAKRAYRRPDKAERSAIEVRVKLFSFLTVKNRAGDYGFLDTGFSGAL